MMPRHHFVFALGQSWGRARMAHGIATELGNVGERATLLSSATLAPKIGDGPFRREPIRSDMGPLLGLYLDRLFTRDRPDTVVLCDYPSNAGMLRRNGVDPSSLLRSDVRNCALDIWDVEATGSDPDVFGGERSERAAAAWAEVCDSVDRLHPVPILWPRTTGHHFRQLPRVASRSRAERDDIRARLGVSAGEKLVCFCTATWQHLDYPYEAARKLAASIPRLVGEHVARAGSDVHLVHVGPQPYALQETLGPRYHWLAQLATSEFEGVLAASDVMISANIAASTVVAAMLLDVPVLVLQNSVRAESVEQAETEAGRRFSERLRTWLAGSLPLYPFALWPIGYHRFLAPVLRDNPYRDTAAIVEVLDEAGIESTLARLLRDERARADRLHRQALYLRRVRSLPAVSELIATPTARE